MLADMVPSADSLPACTKSSWARTSSCCACSRSSTSCFRRRLSPSRVAGTLGHAHFQFASGLGFEGDAVQVVSTALHHQAQQQHQHQQRGAAHRDHGAHRPADQRLWREGSPRSSRFRRWPRIGAARPSGSRPAVADRGSGRAIAMIAWRSSSVSGRVARNRHCGREVRITTPLWSVTSSCSGCCPTGRGGPGRP